MRLQSCSQAGQDVFAFEMCGRKLDGTFLDIGASNLTSCNNSFALERAGWRGLMVDTLRDEEGLKQRRSPLVQADARTLDWLGELKRAGLPTTIDYLSLDVDAATLETLYSMPLWPLHDLRFNVITIEHDAYHAGTGPREKMRFVLKNACGYDLVCADVKVNWPPGQWSEFEDWYVSPHLSKKANRFRSQGKPFTEIIK